MPAVRAFSLLAMCVRILSRHWALSGIGDVLSPMGDRRGEQGGLPSSPDAKAGDSEAERSLSFVSGKAKVERNR